MNYHMISSAHFILVGVFFAISIGNNTECTEYERKSRSTLKDADFQSPSESEFPQRKWISQLFLEAQQKFQMNPDMNIECKKDFELFESHLKNQSIWAVKMMESSEWPVGGILSGTVYYLGNYDECLSISTYGINGKYCLVEAIYDFSHTLQNEVVEIPDGMISAWEAIMMYQENPARIDRKKLKFAICMPSSCEPSDLEVSLQKTLNPVFLTHGLQISVNVSPLFCEVKEELVYSQGYYIVRWFLIGILLLSICSSVYDSSTCENYDQSNKNLLKEASKIFSTARNFGNLVRTDGKDYAALHFPKIINMMFLIFCHRCIHTFGYPTSNAAAIEGSYVNYALTYAHVPGLVDVFFMISGFLTFYYDLVPIVKGGRLFLFFNILLRWIRMVPAFGVVMLYIIHVLPYTGDGPLWNNKITSEVNKCMESWWASLLAINNIVKTDKQCLIVSYYISADIQLTIMGGILLYIFSKNERKSILTTSILFMSSILITFLIAYVNKFHGTLRYYFRTLVDLRADEEFTGLYTVTFTRCAPYLIGFMTAYMVRLLKDKGIKFTNKQIYLFLLTSFLISEADQLYGCLFYKFGREYYRVENALYAALSRSISMTFQAVCICLYFTSGLGMFTKLVEWKVWIPLGRLTYSVFLINTVIQLYHASYQKQPIPMPDGVNMAWWAFGDIILCYTIGLIFHLFIEAPLVNLRIIIKRKLLRSLAKLKQNDDEFIKTDDLKIAHISEINSSNNNGTIPVCRGIRQ